MPGAAQSSISLLRKTAVDDGIGLAAMVLQACADIAVVAFEFLVLTGQPDRHSSKQESDIPAAAREVEL